jgi:hypothetical protein
LADPSGQIPKSTAEVFSAPLNYDKVKALGFVDDNGNSTEKGELFYNLKQAGMFNDDGVITDKGQAYLTPVTEIGKPENLRAFKTLWDDKVIRPSATFSEVASGTGKLLIDAAAGGAERIGQEAQSLFHNSKTWDGFFGNADMRPQKLKDEMTATGLGLIEGATENLAAWAGMADIASAWVGKKVYDVIPVGLDDDAEEALYAARQRQWQTQQDIVNLSAGEVAETVLGIDGAIKAAEEAKSQIGSAEFDKKYGRSQAFANIAADPSNFIPASVAFKASQTAPLASRVALTAQRRLGQIAAQDLAIAQAKTAIESANSVLKKEALTVGLANKMSSDIAARAGSNPELVARASRASQVAQRITNDANKIRETLPIVTAELDSLVAKRNSLATRIPEEYSKKALQTMEFGRQVRAMPAKAIGATLERIGNTFSKTDAAITNFLQERGLDQMYTAAVGAAGVAGLAGNPVIGAIGAGAATLKTGKILSNYGKLFRYVGKEMENVRGQIPFWKRVAAHTAPGSFGRGVAHTFNMLDLGGVTSDVLRRTGRGVVVAAPTDLMFEYLSDGADMRPETLYQAASESLVIGGAFAAAGGAFMGTKKRMRELSIGDQLNFMRDMTDPRQKALFQSIPGGVQRAIATYSIANPTLNYVFKDSGSSRYDINTNTAIINVRSTNPIKALVAHETLHHALIKNNMEPGIAALFLGDTKNNTVGGLLRSRDGKLDPNFEAFKNAYYKRLGVEGMSNAEVEAIYPLDKIAVEYFIEKHADQYSSMAESGELGAVAASGAIKRKLGSALETILPRIPVLKDLHFKSGGMIDKNGSWVTGNGILDAEGIKSDPITKKMFRDMNRRSAGLVPGQFDPLISDRPDSGAPIMLDPNDGIDAELLHPLVKVDETGKPILQNGKPVALDRATELERALAGLTAVDVLKRKRDANYAPEKGEAHVDAEGVFQPGWLSNDVLTEMFAKNRYNAEQKRIIREVNRLIRKGTGDRMVMVNFPATTRNKAGKIVYKPQGATLRDTVPVAITISKDGNLLFGLMSVTKLQENIQKRSQSKRGKRLYGGNVDLILRDVQAMMDYHRKGVDSIEFFKDKYGAVEADERKKFINTMFGLLNQKEQAVLNPILIEDGIKSRDNVYRTYRADRVSKAVPMSPEEYPAMPFSYEAVSGVKMPEQRQMPEVAVIPERFTGSKEDIDRRGKYVEPPGFFKRFNIGSYERGGRFFDASNGEDLTGKQYATGSIDVSTGKPRLFVDNISDVAKSGAKFKTNLFKQSAGWKWTSKNPPSTSTIVSVEGQGKHVYSLKANFESGVELARYSEKKSEPRLRPTAYGELKLGNKVGEISIRGKLHPVYDSIGVVSKSQGSRLMPEVSPEDLNPVANRQEAEALFADGKRLFAFNEMDETSIEITSASMLNAYTPDAIGWMEPDIEPVEQNRFMPEGKPKIISEGTKDALPVIQALGKDGNPKIKDGEPVPQIIPYDLLASARLNEYDRNDPVDRVKPNYQGLAYDVPKRAQDKINQAINSGAVDNVVKDIVKRTREYLKNPEIAAGMGWYSRMRVKLVNALGESGRETLSQLLGATSARTPVRENFLQAMDAYEGIQTGRYEENRMAYIDMLQLQESGTLKDSIISRDYLSKVQYKINDIEEKAYSLNGSDKKSLIDEAKKLQSLISKNPDSWNPSDMAKIFIIATDMLPRRSNGKKFNANSLAVLKVVHGSWLDNRDAPKTPNFAGNLSGRTLQATIDVWAARFLRSVLYEGKNKQWRIQPRAESAVSNEDFALGQVLLQRAAKKLSMNPDDLQAVLWFAEKDRWDKMGWTKKVGAEKSSFDDIFSIFFPSNGKPLNFKEASAKLAFQNE